MICSKPDSTKTVWSLIYNCLHLIAVWEAENLLAMIITTVFNETPVCLGVCYNIRISWIGFHWSWVQRRSSTPSFQKQATLSPYQSILESVSKLVIYPEWVGESYQLWPVLELHLWDVCIWWNLNQIWSVSCWGNTWQTDGQSFHNLSGLAKCH